MQKHLEAVRLPGACFERHFSVKEVAELWNMSVDTVRRLFEHESGVIRYGHVESLHRRKYVTMSIPQSAVERVYRRLTETRPGKPN